MEEKENLVKKATVRLRFNFKEFLFHLSKYKQEFGNVNVKKSYICSDEYKLGEKIGDIRKGHIKLTTQQMAKLNEIGFVLNTKIKFKFNKFYQHLLEYKQKFGNLNVKYAYVCEDGYKLGNKISNIRIGRVKLTEQQKSKLNEVGFVWGVKNGAKGAKKEFFNFKIFYKKLLEYKRIYNNLNIPQKYVCNDGYKLGIKVMGIRAGRIKLTEKQKLKLDEIGFIWNAKAVFDFDKLCEHLLKYKQQFGNLNIQVKHVCEDGYKLGKKVSSIRGGIIKVTEQRKAKLDEIGFVYGKPRRFDFDKLYQRLLEYKKQFGDVKVPSLYVCNDGYKLGQKVSSIRMSKIKITKEQNQKLSEIGFAWNVRIGVKLKKFGFGTFYKKLLEYKQQFGDCLVEHDYIVDNYELGLFVRSIRNRRIKLTDAQLQKLKDLDFIFNTQDYYKNKPDVSLIKRMANGDISARNHYIEKHMPIVYKTASKYKDLSNYTDLINVGYDALTYALDETNVLHEQQIKNYVKKAILREVMKFIKNSKNIDSLSDNVYGLDDTTLEDTIVDNTYRPDLEVDNRTFNEQLLLKAQQVLTNDEFKLICLRFGFNKKGEAYTVNQLAQKFDTTPQKVEKAVQKILTKLKQNMPKEEWLV